jgi:Ricin-type beta-trefoil lectin domain-like
MPLPRCCRWLVLALLPFFPSSAQALSCWEVIGWTPPNSYLQQAQLVPAACTTIPMNAAWVQVTLDYGTSPPDELWLRLSLSDPHVTGWQFKPLLVYSHHTATGVPVVNTDLILCTGCSNQLWLKPFPPAQGVPTAGTRVRLRHRNTGKCLYSVAQNGATAYNWDCWNDPGMTYVLDAAPGGTFRLRHQATGQCLYAVGTNGAPLYNWGCWDDPNMRFQLVPADGGYRLEHVWTSPRQCPYGNPANGGAAHTWNCWNDPAMVYRLDILP